MGKVLTRYFRLSKLHLPVELGKLLENVNQDGWRERESCVSPSHPSSYPKSATVATRPRSQVNTISIFRTLWPLGNFESDRADVLCFI